MFLAIRHSRFTAFFPLLVAVSACRFAGSNHLEEEYGLIKKPPPWLVVNRS